MKVVLDMKAPKGKPKNMKNRDKTMKILFLHIGVSLTNYTLTNLTVSIVLSMRVKAAKNRIRIL